MADLDLPIVAPSRTFEANPFHVEVDEDYHGATTLQQAALSKQAWLLRGLGFLAGLAGLALIGVSAFVVLPRPSQTETLSASALAFNPAMPAIRGTKFEGIEASSSGLRRTPPVMQVRSPMERTGLIPAVPALRNMPPAMQMTSPAFDPLNLEPSEQSQRSPAMTADAAPNSMSNRMQAGESVVSGDSGGNGSTLGWLSILAFGGAVSALVTIMTHSRGQRVKMSAAAAPSEAAETKWTNVATGPATSGHTAASTEDGTVYLFGGRPADQSAGQVTDELWRFSPVQRTWELLSPTGEDCPGPRMYSSAFVVGNTMVLAGGWNPGEKGSGGTFLDDVWALDRMSAGELKWRRLGALPGGAVSRHVAARIDDRRGILHSFKSSDSVLLFEDDKFVEQATTGEAPDSLGLHAGTVIGRDFVVFGGGDKTGAFNPDAFALDMRTWVWTRLKPISDRPPALGGLCVCAIGNNSLIAYGGAEMRGAYDGGGGLFARGETWQLTLLQDDSPDDNGQTCKWTRLLTDEHSSADGELSPTAPLPRVAASLNQLATGELLLHGGWIPSDGSTIGKSELLTL